MEEQTRIVRETLIEMFSGRKDITLCTYIHADGEEGAKPVEF